MCEPDEEICSVCGHHSKHHQHGDACRFEDYTCRCFDGPPTFGCLRPPGEDGHFLKTRAGWMNSSKSDCSRYPDPDPVFPLSTWAVILYDKGQGPL